jgi:deazaflavin-dependent oxidoreductase (nitroreductase family)
VPVLLYRWHLGVLLGRRFLLLTHVGRRSGRNYATVVEVVGHRDASYYVISGFGRSADWYLNVLAVGTARIQVGRRKYAVTVRELDAMAAIRVVSDYEHRNRLAAPVIRRALSRQVGWRYTGTDEDRRRLVDQLPVLDLETNLA